MFSAENMSLLTKSASTGKTTIAMCETLGRDVGLTAACGVHCRDAMRKLNCPMTAATKRKSTKVGMGRAGTQILRLHNHVHPYRHTARLGSDSVVARLLRLPQQTLMGNGWENRENGQMNMRELLLSQRLAGRAHLHLDGRLHFEVIIRVGRCDGQRHVLARSRAGHFVHVVAAQGRVIGASSGIVEDGGPPDQMRL